MIRTRVNGWLTLMSWLVHWLGLLPSLIIHSFHLLILRPRAGNAGIGTQFLARTSAQSRMPNSRQIRRWLVRLTVRKEANTLTVKNAVPIRVHESVVVWCSVAARYEIVCRVG